MKKTIGLSVLFVFNLCPAFYAQNCNDLKSKNVEITVKNPDQTEVDIDRERISLAVNGANNAEVRYRKDGSPNWIDASGTVHWLFIPFPLFPLEGMWLLDGDFTLNTDYGNVAYEYQTRVHCTGEGWGPWLTKFFRSSCGNEGFNTTPSDIDSDALTFTDDYATQGRLSDDGGQTFIYTKNYTNSQLVFNNLQPNHEYWFKCRAACDDNVWSPYSALKKVKTKCGIPKANETSHFSYNMGKQIGMSCSRNADQYEFHRRLKGNNNWVSSGSIQTDEYIFPEFVDKGDIYEFQCRIQCGGQWTDWSNIEEYMIPVQCPQPIIGEIGVNQITEQSAHLFCQSGHGNGVIDKHLFRVRESAGANWTEKMTVNTSVDYTNLKPNTEYVMQVSHECTNGVSGNWSNLVFFMTDQDCKIKTSAVDIQNIAYTSALLSCSQTQRDGYTWEVTRVRDDRMINIPNNLPDPTYLLDNLDQMEEYKVRLKVHCGNEMSEYTEPVYFNTLSCPVPSGSDISISSIMNTSAVFIYDGNINQGLHWQYRKAGNANWRSAYSNQSATQIDSLVKNALYEYRLRLQCASLPDFYSDWSPVLNFNTTCLAIIDHFSNVTTSSITVHCNNANADSYEFRYSVEGSGNWNMSQNTTNTSFNAAGLNENTNYEFQVRSYCNNIPSPWSASDFKFTKDMREPACRIVNRSELSANEIGPYSADLNCSRGNADGYTFRYRMVNGGSWIETQKLQTGNYQATGLVEDTRYEFQCKVHCDTMTTDWSDTVRFRTSEEFYGLSSGCPTPFPAEFIASGIGFQTVTFTCLKSADFYSFRYRLSGETVWTELPFQPNSRFNVSGLTAASVYEYQCSLNCNGRAGLYSESKTFKTLTPGFCETLLSEVIQHTNIRTSEASVAVLENAKVYQLRYKILGTDSWDYTDTLSIPLFRLSGLLASTDYVYQVRKQCFNNEVSPFSNSKIFRTLESCNAVSVDDLRVDSIGHTSVLVSSNDPIARSSYLFRYRVVGTKEWTVAFGLTTFKRFAILSPLTPNTEYEFQVLGICSEKNMGAWSESKKFTTLTTNTVHENGHLKFTIYPNPGSYYFMVNNLNSDQPLNWQLRQLNGTILQTGYTPAASQQEILHHLPSGMYFFDAQNTSIRYIQKLIIH